MSPSKPLHAVCEITMGQAPSGDSYNTTNDGLPLVAGAGDFGPLYPAVKKYTTEAAKIGAVGDIILGIRASIGAKVFADKVYCLGRGVAGLRAKPELDQRYLWHWLDEIKSELLSKGRGATFLQVNRNDIRNLEIPLPPLAEQKRIAGILDAADALRAKRRAALAQLDALAQSLFLDLFGDPVTNPRGWEVVTLGDVSEFITGYPFKSNEYSVDGKTIRLCRGANILPGRIDWNDLACWPSNRIGEVTRYLLAPGDIVMAMDRPWISEGFKIAQIKPENCPSLLVQRVARIRGSNSLLNEFLYAILRHQVFARHCRPTETTVPHISPKDIRGFKFPLPPLPLQQQFAAAVESIERQKARHREHLAGLDALFASLQHRAFRGEL